MIRMNYQTRSKALMLLAAALVVVLLCGFLTIGNTVVKAEQGPADGNATAEITFVSKDKKNLKFLYLSGLVLNTDIKGVSYDKRSNTLTLNNIQLSTGDIHYSLTITNMGEDFKLNIVGMNALDYLSLESIGYDTGCTITGAGCLDVGYLDVSSDGKKMVVTIDNTVNFDADSKNIGYENLPAVKISSKVPLTEMESMIQVLGSTKDQLVYEETPSVSAYAYETTTSQLIVKPTRVVKKGTDGKWGYYTNDKLNTSYTGLAGNLYGLWYIKDGLVDFTHNGLTQSGKDWYMVTNGKVDLSFNGLAPNENGNWFVQNGLVQFNYIGPVVINGTKYNVEKGKIK